MKTPLPLQLPFDDQELWKLATAANDACASDFAITPSALLDSLSRHASAIDDRIISAAHNETLRAERDEHRRRADQTHAAYVGVDGLYRASREREHTTEGHRQEAFRSLEHERKQVDRWLRVALLLAKGDVPQLVDAVRAFEAQRDRVIADPNAEALAEYRRAGSAILELIGHAPGESAA